MFHQEKRDTVSWDNTMPALIEFVFEKVLASFSFYYIFCFLEFYFPELYIYEKM